MRESAHSLRKDSGLKPKATMLIVGCGYIGQRMAQQLIQNKQTVTGVVRSDASLNTLQQLGIEAIQCDLDQKGLPQNSTKDET
jgi:ketopantoate reductase